MNFFSLFKRALIYKFKNKINVDRIKSNKKKLDELFFIYGSDKSKYLNSKKELAHGYSRFYSKHLDFLKKKKIKILEIGSYSGASAVAFCKYFKKSEIYCLDINISKFKYTSKKIHVYGLDILNFHKIKKIFKSLDKKKNFLFDFIIDDGSHNLKDILFSLKNLFPYVKKGGFYIIEDYKFPNYYSYNKNINHILVDNVLNKIKIKKFFNSNIFTKKDQYFIHNNIKNIYTYKGNLKHSDICFLKKK